MAIDLDRCLTLLKQSDEVSIASNPALVIGGIGLIGVGFLMSFVGGFFVWVTYMAMQWAFGGLSSSHEYLYGIVIFGVLSSPFFLGLPVMILGLWLSVVQGLRWRGRTQYTSGKAVASLAFASLTPLLNLLAAIPSIVLAGRAFGEVKRNPRVKGRVLAMTAVLVACAGMVFSTWMIARATYLYTAFQAVDRARRALVVENLDDAIFESRVATTRYPAMAYGWKIRGEALVLAGRHKEAVDALTQGTVILAECCRARRSSKRG